MNIWTWILKMKCWNISEFWYFFKKLFYLANRLFYNGLLINIASKEVWSSQWILVHVSTEINKLRVLLLLNMKVKQFYLVICNIMFIFASKEWMLDLQTLMNGEKYSPYFIFSFIFCIAIFLIFIFAFTIYSLQYGRCYCCSCCI